MEVEARRRQQQKLRSTFATWRTDREEEEEEEEEIANLTLNGRTTDETIANFQKRLPELEQRKRDAKAALNEAETRLRQVLGRRPLEIDRRDDVVWARAALAYQEADEALCLAQALTTWED
jgi:chromosome segregation ATPase